MTRDPKHTLRPTVAELISEAARNATGLFSSEVKLLKAETKDGIRQLATGLALMLLGVVFAVVAATLIVEAAVEALAIYVGSEALAAAIMAVVTLVLAGGLFFYAMHKISNFSLTPERTIRSVRKDSQIVTEKVA